MHAKKTAFIVEHDFIMATYLADRVIVFDGQPGINARANKPESLLTGCNKFLKNLDVTFRRDPTNYRPRINKLNSQLDQEQKLGGNYVSQRDGLASRVALTVSRSSSWRTTAQPPPLEKGGPRNDGHKNNGGHNGNYDSHEHAPPSAGNGVLGVQNSGTRRTDGVHDSSGLDEEGGGDEADEPDD